MKKVVSIALALVISLSLSLPALAANIPLRVQSFDSEIVPFAEETEWRYRIYNGEYQKRLWSITYERWLTDWMPLTAVV